MKKTIKTLAVGITLGLCAGAFAMQPNIPALAQIIPSKLYYESVLRGSSEVTIQNTALRSAICNLLGKTADSRLYSDDFLTCPTYRDVTTTNPDTGITTVTPGKHYLDLSYTGVKDISELVQFEFPETLSGISLMGNGIENSDLNNILTVITSNKATGTININGVDYKVNSNFDTIIKKVNLNLNNIDFETLSDTFKSNENLLFGLQNMPENEGLLTPSELASTKYYIRTNDDVYLSYNFFYNGERIYPTLNTVSKIATDTLGDYKIELSSPPQSESSYFFGQTKTLEFTQFEFKIKDGYTIERKALFNLDFSKTGINKDYILNGISRTDCDIAPATRTDTNTAGTNYTAVKITYKNYTRTLSLPFTVVDTISPQITLRGYSTMYWRQNKSWVDPGYLGSDSGDDLTNQVTIDLGGLDVTKLGSYTIKYTLKDLVGNETTTTRTVIVQESILDEIKVTCEHSDFNVGEEILLTVSPSSNTPLSKYSNFRYSWYMDGVLFKTTTGDSTTGKSSTVVIMDNSGTHKISVILTATQVADNREVMVESDFFEIKAKTNISSQNSIIIALVVAIASIAIITITATIIKAKKATKKAHKQHAKKSSNSADIKVIKDYETPKDDNKK